LPTNLRIEIPKIQQADLKFNNSRKLHAVFSRNTTVGGIIILN